MHGFHPDVLAWWEFMKTPISASEIEQWEWLVAHYPFIAERIQADKHIRYHLFMMRQSAASISQKPDFNAPEFEALCQQYRKTG